MTKQKKLIEDSSYELLVNNLVGAMRDSNAFPEIKPNWTLGLRSTVLRTLYHEIMIQACKNIKSAFDTLKLDTGTAMDDLIKYHDELIQGDVNHQHPKNVYSELLKVSDAVKGASPLIRAAFRAAMLSIPIDADHPVQLIDLIEVHPELIAMLRLGDSFQQTYTILWAHSI